MQGQRITENRSLLMGTMKQVTIAEACESYKEPDTNLSGVWGEAPASYQIQVKPVPYGAGNKPPEIRRGKRLRQTQEQPVRALRSIPSGMHSELL